MTASLCPSKSGYSFPSKPLPIYIIGYVKEGLLSRIFSFFPSQDQEQVYPVPEPEQKFLPPASLDKNQPAIFQFSFPCQRIDHISQKAKQKTQQKKNCAVSSGTHNSPYPECLFLSEPEKDRTAKAGLPSEKGLPAQELHSPYHSGSGRLFLRDDIIRLFLHRGFLPLPIK